MSRKKVSPISLYLKDLRKSNAATAYDMKSAAIKFKSLSVRDKDVYEVAAKRINEKSTCEVEFTTQRDALGNNMKEVKEKGIRKKEWFKNSQHIIKDMVMTNDALNKEFVVVKVSGVDFCRSENNESCYATSEICFIKFTMMKGITDKLILFPDIINVAPGYRQHLYEDLEENVGWKPETFRMNHSIKETILEIRHFFNGVYGPIYVPTSEHLEEVGLALYTLYAENEMSCPWIESFDDWGKNCKIYQMEYLIASILNKMTNMDDPIDKGIPNVSVVLDHWRNLKVEIAPETCERHLEYGLANQCCTNLLTKYVYGSFVLLPFEQMPELHLIVSEVFYRDMDFIIGREDDEDLNLKKKQSNNMWSNYYFEKSGIEDIITNFNGITIRHNGDSVSSYKKPAEWGRGRGMLRQSDNGPSAPGMLSGSRKLKLPKVIC